MIQSPHLFLFMKVPIPDDWQESQDGYVLGLICLPNSQMWRSLVRGKIQELARGRIWDEQTGIIKQAQTVGWAIYDSFMTCKLDDLVTAVENINITLTGLSGNTVSEKIAFELARMNYNLDRIRDNLDSHAPDGEETTEYGLATLLAALGPNIARSTAFIEAIKDGLNSNLVGLPSDGEFAEGTSPALPDVMGKVTGFSASLNGENGQLSITCDFNTQVLVESYGKFQEYLITAPSKAIVLYAADGWIINSGGKVTVIDQKFNVFTDTY